MSEKFENGNTRQAIGMLMTVAGTPAAIIGFEGLDQHEAARPEDAIGSISMPDRDYFITSEDLAPGTLASAGLAVAALGAYFMLHRKKS